MNPLLTSSSLAHRFRIDELDTLRFYVSRGGEKWLVDLLSLPRAGEKKFNGRCDCWKFKKTHLPRFESKKVPVGDLTRCEHIKACRELVADRLVWECREWKGKDEDE